MSSPETLQIEELLKNGFTLTKNIINGYRLNKVEIDRETFEDIWNSLYVYLDRNCEKVDEYSYAADEDDWRTVAMYRCPNGKVGIFEASGDGVGITRVYVGDGAWRNAKNDAIDDIESTIEWLESIDITEEITERLKRDLDEVTHMPE